MPHWNLTVDLEPVWADFQEDRDLKKAINRTLGRIKQSGWRKLTPYPDHFDSLLHDLGAATNLAEFDAAFEELYDQADSDRVWLETS